MEDLYPQKELKEVSFAYTFEDSSLEKPLEDIYKIKPLDFVCVLIKLNFGANERKANSTDVEQIQTIGI